MKKWTLLLCSTALCAGLAVVGTPSNAALANVNESEFESLKAQMQLFASKLKELEGEQKVLKSENASLKQQNTKLQAKNADLEKNLVVTLEKTKAIEKATQSQATKLAAINPSDKDAAKNGALIPGTDTRVKLGGYVKVDAIHDLNVSRTGGGEDFGLYAAIPLKGSVEDQRGANTRIHARQTRLNLTTTSPTKYGDLKVFVEGDFFSGTEGNQNSTNAAEFGLRHAYGELGGFLVGQTWSNYMDLAAYPESLDFQGVSGNTLLRQGQIRYTYQPQGSQTSYSVSLENPASDFLSNPANSGADTSINRAPDVTFKARHQGEYGELSLKGVGRKVEAFNSANPNSDSDFAYAIAASGKINTIGKDDFRFQVAYGDGIGRYIFDLAATTQAAGFDADNDAIEAIEAWGGYVAYRHWWTDDLRSNIIAGTTQVLDNPSFLNADVTNESIYSAHGNLIWSVTDKVDVGAEYIYGYRETESGLDGDLHRLQASATYKF